MDSQGSFLLNCVQVIIYYQEAEVTPPGPHGSYVGKHSDPAVNINPLPFGDIVLLSLVTDVLLH